MHVSQGVYFGYITENGNEEHCSGNIFFILKPSNRGNADGYDINHFQAKGGRSFKSELVSFTCMKYVMA